MARRSKLNNGFAKSHGYINRVYTVEYDLHGMIQAYGLKFVHWLADEIAEGRINCKQDVDRWSAHLALGKHRDFDKVASTYGEQSIDDLAA